MYRKERVAATLDQINALNIDPAVEVGTPDAFGLGLDIFDPVSGQIITVFRPQRSDIGQSEIALTAAQIAQAVAAARTVRLHAVRQAGFASLEDAEAAAKREAGATALAAKHAAELDELQTTHAVAAAEQAAASAPKKAPPEEKALQAPEKQRVTA